MAIILQIETATTNCSVALSKDGKTLALKEDYNSNFAHAESLNIFIEDVFKTAKFELKDIDAVAISKGPGSYTGLRIGVSTAKGLCYALDKPLIAVDTLKSIAAQVAAEDAFVIPMLDARRLEVYAAVYDSDCKEIRAVAADVLTETSFKEYLDQSRVYFIGNGVAKFEALIQHPNAVFITDKLPSAAQMSGLAFDKYKIGDFEDVAYFEPFYLKDFIGNKS